nr:hypothetical protein [uncultured Desulfuromonas sp.]
MNKLLTGKELAEKLCVSDCQVSRWYKNEGCPKTRRRYDLVAVCQWILATKSPQSKVRYTAKKILSDLSVSQPQSVPPAEETEEENGPEGLQAALERLRTAEVKAHSKWQAAFSRKDPDTENYFRVWQNSIELLRKSEASLLDVLKERRELLPASEVKAWLAKRIEMAKGRLLEIPAKVAPMTEDLEWPDVQKLLQQEIYEALEYLASSKVADTAEN